MLLPIIVRDVKMLQYKIKCIIVCILLLIISNNSYSIKPITIPEIKQWNDSQGNYIYSKNIRIVVDPQYKSVLEPIANTFAQDLELLNKSKHQVIYSTSVSKGDIFLTMNSTNPEIGEEGYSLEINESISIDATSENGVFYGTRSIIQMLKQSDSIQCGNATDYPDYPERGIMLDAGRKYYSVEWIKNHLREISYLKMNVFHFQISNFSGFRLECESFPQIRSAQYYTKSEIQEIFELAKQYHIEVIPEIDIPNHMSAILEHFPQFQIKKFNGESIGDCCIDFTRPEVREFIATLINEYCALFPGKYWNMGADEFLSNYSELPQFEAFAKNKYGKQAKPKDAFVDFINWVDSLVKTKNKTLRIWNDIFNDQEKDPMTIDLNKDIIVEYWIGNSDPQMIADKGHKLLNTNSDYLYYVVGNGWRPNKAWMIKGWNPQIFQKERSVKPKESILGGKICIWADIEDALTEVQVAKELSPSLRTLAHRTWNANQIDTSYAEFEQKIKIIGLAPGVEFPKIPLPNDLALYKRVVVSSQEKNTTNFPLNVVDGDYDTRWSSDYVDTAWIYVDLEKIYNITRVKLFWEYSFAREYQIQVSNDSLNWTEIADIKNNNGGVNDFRQLNGSGRYVRIYCTKRNNDCGHSLWEFEVYDSTQTNIIIDNQNPISNNLTIMPNPFYSEILINIAVPQNNNNVSVAIYDLIGNKIEQITDQQMLKGNYTLNWKPKSIVTGNYIIVAQIGTESEFRRIVYLGE